MRLRALKTFMDRGQMVEAGDEFTTSQNLVDEYLTRELAVRLDGSNDPKDGNEQPATPADVGTEFGGELGALDAEQWANYNVAQLKTFARNMGIARYTNMNKAELIEALSNAR